MEINERKTIKVYEVCGRLPVGLIRLGALGLFCEYLRETRGLHFTLHEFDTLQDAINHCEMMSIVYRSSPWRSIRLLLDINPSDLPYIDAIERYIR